MILELFVCGDVVNKDLILSLEVEKMSLKLFACGDVVNFKSKKDFIDAKLETLIKSCDVAICNFEAPIEHENMQKIKKAGPHLYQSKKSIEFLQKAGFNFVSLANNHIYDYGQQGIEKTIEELKRFNIEFVGGGIDFDEAYKPKIIEKNGIRLGLLAGCENEFGCLYEEQNRGGYAWLLHHKIEDNVRELKTKCDFIVLIAHAGVENIEIPIKEWRDVYKRLCDIGVDVIIGHHPHVPQGYEKYKNSLIFYSLGNFYFDTLTFENKSDDSYSVLIEMDKIGEKKELKFDLIFHKKVNGQTRLVSEGEVNFNIEHLCNLLSNEDEYVKRNNEICIKLFNDYYYDYYIYALDSMPIKSIKNKIKYIIRKLLFKDLKNDERNLLLLHNIMIESHRYVVQRALRNLYGCL